MISDPLRVGRNAAKVKALARTRAIDRRPADLDTALADPSDFDAAFTQVRPPFLKVQWDGFPRDGLDDAPPHDTLAESAKGCARLVVPGDRSGPTGRWHVPALEIR